MKNRLIQTLVLGILKIYFSFKSAILDPALISFFGFTSKCRYQPSCSRYTFEMIEKYGTISGLKKGFTRLLGCWGLH